jgi:hypothetical protein
MPGLRPSIAFKNDPARGLMVVIFMLSPYLIILPASGLTAGRPSLQAKGTRTSPVQGMRKEPGMLLIDIFSCVKPRKNKRPLYP